MGIDEETFYDTSRIAIVPMGFCFPGYSAKGSDLPPPAICARTWRKDVLASLPNTRLTLVIGSHAMRYHLESKVTVTQAVQAWRSRSDDTFVLPHPSWRNTGWLRKNPWFEKDVVPRLRARIEEILND